MDRQKVLDINKALANPARFAIIKWLKEPEKNFPPHTELKHFDYGVCGQYLKNKSELSQPTISHYLSTLQNAGLITSTRIGKWTYFKRNEVVIAAFKQYIADTL